MVCKLKAQVLLWGLSLPCFFFWGGGGGRGLGKRSQFIGRPFLRRCGVPIEAVVCLEPPLPEVLQQCEVAGCPLEAGFCDLVQGSIAKSSTFMAFKSEVVRCLKGKCRYSCILLPRSTPAKSVWIPAIHKARCAGGPNLPKLIRCFGLAVSPFESPSCPLNRQTKCAPDKFHHILRLKFSTTTNSRHLHAFCANLARLTFDTEII